MQFKDVSTQSVRRYLPLTKVSANAVAIARASGAPRKVVIVERSQLPVDGAELLFGEQCYTPWHIISVVT